MAPLSYCLCGRSCLGLSLASFGIISAFMGNHADCGLPYRRFCGSITVWSSALSGLCRMVVWFWIFPLWSLVGGASYPFSTRGIYLVSSFRIRRFACPFGLFSRFWFFSGAHALALRQLSDRRFCRQSCSIRMATWACAYWIPLELFWHGLRSISAFSSRRLIVWPLRPYASYVLVFCSTCHIFCSSSEFMATRALSYTCHRCFYCSSLLGI